MNDQATKVLKFMKWFWAEIQEIKNHMDNMANRMGHSEYRISKLEYYDVFKIELWKDTLNKRKRKMNSLFSRWFKEN